MMVCKAFEILSTPDLYALNYLNESETPHVQTRPLARPGG